MGTAHHEGTGPGSLDAVIVGAGFAGLYALHRLRDLGLRARVYDRAAGVGGTWFWNRYPGCRCDIESLLYSYSFSDELQREWRWTHRYAAQPEILAYLNHVADRFDLRRDIQLETGVTAAVYDDDAGMWEIETDGGERVTARFCVMATGCLSDAQVPDIHGLDRFTGDWYHTARWPHEGVDFSGKRVAVIGTGSSGIQSAPVIAAQAEHLYVLQRTPQYSVPAWNAPLGDDTMRRTQEDYGSLRQRVRESFIGVPFTTQAHGACEATPDERQKVFEEGWEQGGYLMLLTYPDLLFNEESNALAAEFVRAKLRARIHDPAVADRIIPTTYPLGAKRLCVDTDYFEIYNRENVTLVDLRETPLEEVTPTGFRTSHSLVEVDIIVFATGFDAMTGALLKMDIRGREGLTLREKWAAGPSTYLGVAVSGFPNLFTVTGPGSPSVLTNMVPAIEEHVDWIADCVAHLRESGLSTIEAQPEAEAAWTAQVDEIASQTLYPRANSWYMGRNVPGKVEGFMPYAGGSVVYRQVIGEVAADGYRGFALERRK